MAARLPILTMRRQHSRKEDRTLAEILKLDPLRMDQSQ